MTYRDTLPPYARAAFDHADAIRACHAVIDAASPGPFLSLPDSEAAAVGAAVIDDLVPHLRAMRDAQSRMAAFASA